MSTWMDLGEKEAEKVYSGIPGRQAVKEQSNLEAARHAEQFFVLATPRPDGSTPSLSKAWSLGYGDQASIFFTREDAQLEADKYKGRCAVFEFEARSGTTVQEKFCECDKRQPGSPFTDGKTVCVNCSGIIWRGLPDFDTAVKPGFGGFRLVETPLASERRAFWREAFHSVDWDRTREADEVTKMCAKFADAALKEFDERFGK